MKWGLFYLAFGVWAGAWAAVDPPTPADRPVAKAPLTEFLSPTFYDDSGFLDYSGQDRQHGVSLWEQTRGDNWEARRQEWLARYPE